MDQRLVGIEERVARIWAEVLRVPAQRLTEEDHFFALGGDSSLVAEVREKIMEEFAIELSIGVLFDAAKMGELAKAIEANIRRAGSAA